MYNYKGEAKPPVFSPNDIIPYPMAVEQYIDKSQYQIINSAFEVS